MNGKARYWASGVILALVVISLIVWNTDTEDKKSEREVSNLHSDMPQVVGEDKNSIKKLAMGLTSSALPPVAISGAIKTEDGEKTIPGATVCASCAKCDYVLIDSKPTCVKADANGQYTLKNLPPGKYIVSASAPGYSTSSVNQGKPIKVGEEGLSLDDQNSELDEGEGLVTGVVKNTEGKPVGGAVVRAIYEPVDVPDHQRVSHETVADANGRFSLWCTEGRLRLIAMAEGYAPADVFRFAPVSNVELTLFPTSSISGTVVALSKDGLDKGSPVPNVTILARSSTNRQVGTSDSNGRFSIRGLKPGVYYLKAQGNGWYGDFPGTVALDMSDTVDDLVFPVTNAVAVQGSLLTNPGQVPCKMGSVTLSSPGMDALLPSLTMQPDADGEVTFEAVPPGQYSVWARCADHGTQELQSLTVGREDLAGLIWTLEPKLSITGRVLDEKGTPVGGQLMQLRPKPQPGMNTDRPSLYAQTIPSTDVGFFGFHGLPAGGYLIFTEYLEEPVEVELSPENSPVKLNLEIVPVGQIAVRVVNPRGEPVDNLTVVAKGITKPSIRPAVELGRGSYKLERLQTGLYEVYAGDGKNPRVRAGGPSGEVEVIAGETTEVEVPYGGYQGRIAGIVRQGDEAPAVNVRVQAITTDHSGDHPYVAREQYNIIREESRSVTDQDGRFEITGLAENGTFDVLAERPPLGGAAVVENVRPGTNNVVITLEAPGTLSGIAVDPAGEPVERFSIQVHNDEARQEISAEINNPKGQWQFENISPGTVVLSARDHRNGNMGTITKNLAPNETLKDLFLELKPR